MRAQKLERRVALHSLLEKIAKQPLSLSEKQRFLATLMAKTVSGKIAPSEARKLTKAVTQERKG